MALLSSEAFALTFISPKMSEPVSDTAGEAGDGDSAIAALAPVESLR